FGRTADEARVGGRYNRLNRPIRGRDKRRTGEMDRKLIAAIAAIAAAGLEAIAFAALAGAASVGTALAPTGQVLCLSGTQVSGPNSSGQCKGGQTQVTVATQSEVSVLQEQVSSLKGQVSA